MEVPAAGAEVPLVDARAASVLMGEEEVPARARRGSAAGCCRCSRCEVVLATLLVMAVVAVLVMAVVAVLAVGGLLRAESKPPTHTHTQSSAQAPANLTTCLALQWGNNVKDYHVFSIAEDGYYHVYGWIAFTAGPGTAVLKMKKELAHRKFGSQYADKNLTISTGTAHMLEGQRVDVDLRGFFTHASFCIHKLPEEFL